MRQFLFIYQIYHTQTLPFLKKEFPHHFHKKFDNYTKIFTFTQKKKKKTTTKQITNMNRKENGYKYHQKF